MTKRRASRGSSRRSIPVSQGRSSLGAASTGGFPSGRIVPERTRTVRVPAPVSHARSTPARTVTPLRSSAWTSAGSLSEAAMTTMTWESSRAAKAASASVRSGCLPTTPDGSSVHAGATSRPQRITMPGPCHSSRRRAMSRQAARELSVGWGGSSRSPTTSTRRPSATGSVRSPSTVSAASRPTPVSGSAPIPRPSCHLRGSRPLRNSPELSFRGVRGTPLGSTFVPQTRTDGDRINWTLARRRRATPAGACRHLRHRRRPVRRRRPSALPRPGPAGLDLVLRGLW